MKTDRRHCCRMFVHCSPYRLSKTLLGYNKYVASKRTKNDAIGHHYGQSTLTEHYLLLTERVDITVKQLQSSPCVVHWSEWCVCVCVCVCSDTRRETLYDFGGIAFMSNAKCVDEFQSPDDFIASQSTVSKDHYLPYSVCYTVLCFAREAQRAQKEYESGGQIPIISSLPILPLNAQRSVL